MCGIVGLVAKRKEGFFFEDVDRFTHMVQMDTIRGPDSTGVFGIDSEGDIDFIKGNTNGWTFTQSLNYKNWAERMHSSYRFAIGHNRAATKGAVTPDNAHPFKEEHIVLVHNGTIRNQEDLNKASEVDSHAIAVALSKDAAKEALGQIDGAYALVWYDQKHRTLNLARNDERPLFILEYTDFYAIASEPGLPFWLCSRDQKKPMAMPKLVPTEKILEINLDKIEDGFKEIVYEEYQYVHVPLQLPVVMPQSPYIRPLHVVRDRPDKPDLNAAQLQAGKNIVFKIDDVKSDEENKIWTIFGFPIFNNEIDENILVRTEVHHPDVAKTLIDHGILEGTITSVGTMGSMPFVMARYPTKYKAHMDIQENVIQKEDLKFALADGCQRCKGVILEKDVPNSILRLKKDGTWRRLCPSCLQQAKDNVRADLEQPSVH